MAGNRTKALEALAIASLHRKRGRPKGTKQPATLEREKVKRALDQRFMRATEKIANAQIALASGLSFLYKIHTDKKGNRGRPELITAQYEIEAYLSGDYEHNEEGDYYYITTEAPNNQAIDSILNRVHGKPKESIDFSGEVKFSLKGLAEMREAKRLEREGKVIEAHAEETQE